VKPGGGFELTRSHTPASFTLILFAVFVLGDKMRRDIDVVIAFQDFRLLVARSYTVAFHFPDTLNNFR
jgi:hypothetical protein